MTWSAPHSASQPSQAPQFQPGPDPVMFEGDDNIWQQQEEQKQVSKELETSIYKQSSKHVLFGGRATYPTDMLSYLGSLSHLISHDRGKKQLKTKPDMFDTT